MAEHEAALLGDREAYREALRCYMKAGRDAAPTNTQGGVMLRRATPSTRAAA